MKGPASVARAVALLLVHGEAFELTRFSNALDEESKMIGGPVSLALDSFIEHLDILVGVKIRREKMQDREIIKLRREQEDRDIAELKEYEREDELHKRSWGK